MMQPWEAKKSPIFWIASPDDMIFSFDNAQHRKIFLTSHHHIFLAHGDSKPLLGSYVKSPARISFLYNRI